MLVSRGCSPRTNPDQTSSFKIMSEALRTAHFHLVPRYHLLKERSHHKCSLHWAPAGYVAAARVCDQQPYIWLGCVFPGLPSTSRLKLGCNPERTALRPRPLCRKVAQSTSNSPSPRFAGLCSKLHARAGSPGDREAWCQPQRLIYLLWLPQEDYYNFQEIKNYIPHDLAAVC